VKFDMSKTFKRYHINKARRLDRGRMQAISTCSHSHF